MRQITVKYTGQCSKCGSALQVGAAAMYEKTTGIFCVGCEPTDTEDIRQYRQAKADAKADKYETWAAKRRADIEPILNAPEDHYSRDLAFITQPGHIPARARWIAKQDRAFESLQVAERMEEKADNIRHVHVKGDAETKRNTLREIIKAQLKVGMKVCEHGEVPLEIIRINKKTVSLKSKFAPYPGSPGYYVRDISFLSAYVENGETIMFNTQIKGE